MANPSEHKDHRGGWAKLETEKPKPSVMGQLFRATVFLGLAGFAFLWLAIPTCACSTRVKAYGAAMKSDLKNLASQQEIYYSDAYSYTTVVSDLAFTNSDGVVVRIEASGDGWTAAASHVGFDFERGCAIYYGDVVWPMSTPEGRRPEQPGEVVCDPTD